MSPSSASQLTYGMRSLSMHSETDKHTTHTQSQTPSIHRLWRRGFHRRFWCFHVHPVWRRVFISDTDGIFTIRAYKMMLHCSTNVFHIEHFFHQHHISLFVDFGIFRRIVFHISPANSSKIIYWTISSSRTSKQIVNMKIVSILCKNHSAVLKSILFEVNLKEQIV